MSAYRKIGVSVPKETAKQLDFLSMKFDVSRSQIVSELLGPALENMVGILESLPENPSPEAIQKMGLSRLESHYTEYRSKLGGAS